MIVGSKKAADDNEILELAKEIAQAAYVPPSVYRLQFNKQFTFRDARAAVPFLRALGAGAVYASPYFQAVPGSAHGYDVTDPQRLNPELGTEAEYEAFCDELKKNGMGQVLDIVPNHMGISGGRNRWWNDVLENGPGSSYAHFFDVDWEPEKKELRNKVLIPVLGDLYGRVLENGEIKFEFLNGEFAFAYYDTRFPAAPKSYPAILERGLDELGARIGKDHGDFHELLSILTSFRNLPEPGPREDSKIHELSREKEIAKKRLASLAASSDDVRRHIEAAVAALNGRKGDAASWDALDRLLGEQYFRLAHWRVASEEINYRRFFNVNELAAIRIEDARVFAEHHKLVFDLLSRGRIQGLRIDHPDGLYDPPSYFENLQKTYLARRIAERLPSADPEAVRAALDSPGALALASPGALAKLPLYVVAEKILDRKESLVEDWKVHGTVGYDYLNALNRLFVDSGSEKAFDRIYREFAGPQIDFADLMYSTKKFFALVNMAGEINMLGSRLDRISEQSRRYRDLTRNNLTLAIREVIACFPVYRTYISPRDARASERDEKYIRIAVEKAKRKTPALNPAVYDFLMNVLLMNFKDELGLRSEEEPLYRDFIMRFQQLTGPIMAKGLEDTAFYIHNRFISLNEVGGDPTHFGSSRSDFHRQNAERARRWPCGFLTITTHDTKRSADARMRLNVLSEMPDEWGAAVARWALVNEKHKTDIGGSPEPDRNVEYYFYQSLAAVWPGRAAAEKDEGVFLDRMRAYMLKSVREANQRTNWLSPDEGYENAVKKFIEGALAPGDDNLFLKNFEPFAARAAAAGMLNSLAGLTLRIGSPGVIDVYHGTEIWDLSLVDPDNRRPRDFEAEMRMLESIRKDAARLPAARLLETLVEQKSDGRIKMYLLWKGLGFRREHPELLLSGDYLPLEIEGDKKEHAVAFLRRSGSKAAIVCAGRFLSGLVAPDGRLSAADAFWGETALVLPKDWKADRWSEIYTGAEYAPDAKNAIPLKALFSRLPAAILTSL